MAGAGQPIWQNQLAVIKAAGAMKKVTTAGTMRVAIAVNWGRV